MSNPQKAKGTRGETAVVKYLRDNGFGLAERRALGGSHDMGDILICPGLIAEVKAGDKAKSFQQSLLEKWMDETRKEHSNADAVVALLIVQRSPYGPERVGMWWCWVTPVVRLAGYPLREAWSPLHLVIETLRATGWGDPL